MIRAGLVGFGMAGRVFHGPLLSSVEGLELAAVMERSTNKAAERYPGITVYRSLEACWRQISRTFRCRHTERHALRARQRNPERR
jgi:predicted homoserine dehydrogenase-like protein